jgi:hypothetical protein
VTLLTARTMPELHGHFVRGPSATTLGVRTAARGRRASTSQLPTIREIFAIREILYVVYRIENGLHKRRFYGNVFASSTVERPEEVCRN